MAAHNVTVLASGAPAERHRVALASLPERYAAIAGPAELALCADAAAVKTAIGNGVRAIVLDGLDAMSAADLSEVAWAAKAAGTIVIPSLTFLPRLLADAGFAGWAVGPVTVISANGQSERVTGLSGLLAEQLLAITHLLGDTVTPSVMQWTGQQYVVRATAADGSVAILSGISNGQRRSEFGLDAIRVGVRLEAFVDAGPLARAPAISISGPGGKTSGLPVHQSATRLLWAELADHLAGQPVPHLMTLEQAMPSLGQAIALLR